MPILWVSSKLAYTVLTVAGLAITARRVLRAVPRFEREAMYS
jgi:hypothetical protein